MALRSPPGTLTELSNEICEECRNLDLQKIMSINMNLPQRYKHGLLVADVGHRFKEMPDNDCPLCYSLFYRRLKPVDSTEARIGDEIRAFSFVYWYEGVDTELFRMSDSGISLCVVPRSFGIGQPAERMTLHFREHGHIFCHDPLEPDFAFISPRALKRDFDPALVQTWLEFCRNHHKSCTPPSSDVFGLRLIDCEEYTLISALPDPQYVALSYVWGQVKAVQIETGSSRIPASKLPPSIFDAIQVTIALGFRYLWVDQYCVEQDDLISKERQIAQMDSIYRNAELTIVVAAGDDPSYGLPGVNSRSRNAQRTARAGRYKIVETMPDPHYSIRASKCFTRAWTFQEGLFSRRSLIFTDDQIYFECAEMNCHEAVECKLGPGHIREESQTGTWMRKGLLGTDLEYTTPHNSFTQVRGLLEQFTARKLTFDDDSLSAFLGVLRYFESQECPVHHFWGVPFIVHEVMAKHYPRNVEAYLIDGLCWRHVYSCWEEEVVQPRRRPKFPSWSWAGWAGPIQHDREPHTHQISPFGPLLSIVQIEYDNGHLTTFNEIVYNSSVDRRSSYPKALLFNAYVVPPEAIGFQLSLEDDCHHWTVAGFPATLNLSHGPSSPTSFLSAIRQQEYHGIIFGVDNRLGMKDKINVFVLIVIGGGPCETVHRCGMMTVQAHHLRDLEPFFSSWSIRRFRLE